MRLPRAARVLIGAALLLVTTSSSAQLDALAHTTPAERAKAQTVMMKSQLGLTDDQTGKVAALNQKYAERMEPVIKGSSGLLMKMRTMRELQQQKEAELEKVLSPAQFQQYLVAKEQMREKLEKQLAKKRAAGGE